jgi:uncharacterized SAM-binding protein YcdF (DUF218 family)
MGRVQLTKGVALGAVTIAGGALALTWLRIRRHGRLAASTPADVIVVFGAAAYANRPSPELAARLRHAASLYQQGLATTIVCSGGHPGPNSEARVMQRALVEAGVPEEATIVEETGSSTRRTLAAVERIGNGRWNRILMVSSPYHMYRIIGEARRLGLPVVASPAPGTPIMKRLRPRVRMSLREVAAVWWYALTAPPRAAVAPAVAVADDRGGPDAPSRSPTEPARLACVVLSLGNDPVLVDAVRSLQAQEPRPEIVVVNSGGGDPGSTLRAAGLDVAVVNLAERVLPGAARNRGIEATSAPVVAFLASDCVVEPGWATARLAAHEEGAAAVAGALTVAPPRTLSAYASHLLLHHRVRPEAPPDDRVLSMLSYRRSVLEQHGPFLEDVLVGEDSDYFERLEPAEVIGWTPGARTAHRYPLTATALLADQFRRGRAAAEHAFQIGQPGARRRIAVRNIRNILFAVDRARAVDDADERRDMLAATPLLVLGAFACALGVLTAPSPRTSGRPEPG